MAAEVAERPAKQAKLEPEAANVIIQFHTSDGDITGAPQLLRVRWSGPKQRSAAWPLLRCRRRRLCSKAAAFVSRLRSTAAAALHRAALRPNPTRTTAPNPQTGPQLDVPQGVTPAQLEALLNGLLRNDEKLPYSFYVEEQELASELGAHLLKSKISVEKALRIVYMPQAVRPGASRGIWRGRQHCSSPQKGWASLASVSAPHPLSSPILNHHNPNDEHNPKLTQPRSKRCFVCVPWRAAQPPCPATPRLCCQSTSAPTAGGWRAAAATRPCGCGTSTRSCRSASARWVRGCGWWLGRLVGLIGGRLVG